MSKPLILIAAGGTGGHLFPAFSLSEELIRRGFDVDLVTDVRADQYGINFPGGNIHQVPSATLRGKSPAAVLKLVTTLARGIWTSKGLLARIKPAAVVGFGGYPTVPPLLAARLAGVPFVIHDANAVMGRANRLLARFANAVAVTFDKTRYLKDAYRSKTHIVGMPVRDVVLEAAGPYRKRSGAETFKLLVFGGSQGARVFADVVPEALANLPQALRARLHLVQQVREEDMDRVRPIYERAGIKADLETFFSDLPKRMADAHLVVGRAGASTVAELTVLGRPAILVPLPHAIDNDQLENATRLQEVGGGWCIEQSEFTPERLRNEIDRLASSPETLEKAAEAAALIGEPRAVVRLADVVEELMRGPVRA